ncbi:Acylphosphatase [Nymphaea thermarum]|nr:Acylphosphatase [Nymphaea thermarum]
MRGRLNPYHRRPLVAAIRRNPHGGINPNPPPSMNSLAIAASSRPAYSNSTTNMAVKTVKVSIKGTVQGVFYRDWTVQNARELGLKGWVRNRWDGSVEALFSGEPDSVEEMERRCRRGPLSAMVTALNVYPADNEDPGRSFERRPTV